MRMFYCIMKGVKPLAANFLSYIPTKYYYNWSTSDLVIGKIKRVNFLKHSVYSVNGVHALCHCEIYQQQAVVICINLHKRPAQRSASGIHQ